MDVLIVVETAFGNTRAVAQHAAEALTGAGPGVRVEVVTAADAPARLPENTGLLLVGGPTHDFTMSKPGTRSQATDKGATEVGAEGIREWIARVEPRTGLRTVTFDTAFEQKLSGSAAKAAAKALRKRGFDRAERGPSFHVGGREGPLREGEEERTAQWAAQLVHERV
ncbi:flavodoxin family protein [Nocardiopsis sp. HNM0947]|uniref:Flavodoxin family protein n=1 Tax=Nocardiopsis coralli TaxID=2772213 RepID=A0ABR9P724_9ACTN|nr:flavodoxin family protein [Nocardiopsis coralli]MBE2999652.1 flavodoxin family protein [Nocardiopsis coralli]